MKILQLMAGARHGGAETAFIDMCLAMREAGEIVQVVTRDNPRNQRLHDAGIKVHILPFGSAVDVWTSFRLRRIIDSFKPDIVQSWMSRASQKIPKHGENEFIAVARLGNYYKLKNFENCDYFVSITPDIKTYLKKEGIAPERVRHINNFAETEIAEKPVSRASLNTPEGAPVLLGLGRLHDAKAFDTLMKAAKDIPDAYVWIAGEGPLREELEAECKALDMKERVRFLGWRDDRAALFQAADICVFSSRFEPFGTVFVQAWAQRTPLVTTDADGPRQFVRDGEDGLIVPVDNVKAMTEAIQNVIQDPKLAAFLVENGHKRYLSEFTKENAVQAYLDYYKEILAARENGKAA